jgi:Cobalamin biosynthesis protein CobT (nicotinate-mononucleotide:5, 6-dimethylbenzimidazole phosphoribosyltransferase)
MPRLQDIERFKRDISALSHEAEVLERWGEKPEKITPPEGAAIPQEAEAAEPSPEGVSAPAQKKPAGAAKPAAAKPAKKAAPLEDEGAPPDFAALLDGLPLESAGEESPESGFDMDLEALLGSSSEEGGGQAPEELGEEAPQESGAGADLDALLGLESEEEAPPAEEAEPFKAEPFGAEPFEAEATEPESEARPETEGFDFTMPDFEAEPEGAPSAGEAEGLAESPEPFEEAETESESLAFEEGPAGPTPSAEESFSIPDFSLDEAEAAPEESEGQSPAEPERDEFSIPDLNAGFEAPEAGAPSPGGAESFGFGESGEAGSGPSDFGDSFESFSFEEPSAGAGIGSSGAFGDTLGQDLGQAAGRDLDTEIASLSEEAPVADTFKLDQDWGEFAGFGLEAKETKKKAAPKTAAAKGPGKAEEEKFKPVSLSEAQVDKLQDSLLSFPLNLRVAVEDIVANGKGSEAQQSKLVWALVEGQAAEEIALLAGKILKRQIPIPKGYEKKTGASLEAEKGTFAYAFTHIFLPVVEIGLLVLAIAGALGYLGWRYVYVPLAADSLYRAGYQRIASDRYTEAEADFAKATSMREYVDWYYRYASAYAGKRQYILAERKYASLVEAHPKETKGILAWARLEKEQLKYEEGVDVLKGTKKKGEEGRGKTGLLSWDYFNPDGLMLLGDIYLDWGEEEPTKYEDARRTYATLLERYGDMDEYLERMLLYFIRVDKEREVLPLKSHFLADPKKITLSAPVLAELGGYLLDKNRLDDVRGILLEAAKKDPSVPESHYNLARYYRRTDSPEEERKALDKAVQSFAALPGLGGARAGRYIDSLVWRGRFLVRDKEWVGAERDYAAAAAEYEKALELRRVKKSGRFAEAYAGLGDVAFWQRDDLAAALAYYDRAEADGYSSPDMDYRRGNMLYRMGRYAESLERFYGAAQAVKKPSPYLDYAFGSALLARKDYFAAEAYFRKVAKAMDTLLAGQGEPMPQESLSQAEALVLDMRAQNNLGVALYRSASRSGDARRRNEAMSVLGAATKLYDQAAQAPALLQGPEGRDLPLANMNVMLSTGRADQLAAYTEIEKDMRFPRK